MKLSSPEYRITLGTLGWVALIFIAIYNVISEHNVNGTVVTTLGATSSLLLGLGIIKKHKNFTE